MANAFNEYLTGKETLRRFDTISDSKASLELMRTFYISSAQAIKVKKERMEEKVKEINSTFLKDKAFSMIEDLKKAFNDEVKTHQEKLREKLSAVLQNKKDASRKFMMIPPSQDQLNLLNSIKLRGAENIPDEEWEEIIKTLAGNYQCAAMLEILAKETQDKPTGKKHFSSSASVAKVDDELAEIKKRFNIAIENLADPYNSPMAMEMIRADLTGSPTSNLIEKLDREIISTIPSGNLSTKNRLKEAAKNALHVGDYELFNQINRFIFDNVSRLETAEETEAEFVKTAEALIEAGNNATEKKFSAKA